MKSKVIKRGISLIVLVITIVVMIILATAVILSLTSSGIIGKANESKYLNIIENIKEEINFNKTNRYLEEEKITEITVEQLLAEGKIRRTVKATEENEDTYYMYYALKEAAYESMGALGKGNLAELTDVFLIDEEFNICYVDKKGRTYGDKLSDKILKDDTIVRFASKEFAAYISKLVGSSEEEAVFAWMKTQTSLTIDDKTITSLEDLVFFPNLTNLQIGTTTAIGRGMKLENLSGIESLSKLTKLNITGVTVKSINEISNLINLKDVETYVSTIEDMSGIRNCSKINRIKINTTNINLENFISEIENLKELEKLEIHNNLKIDKISILKDLETDNLTSLTLSNVGLVDLNGIEVFTNLTGLGLSNNSIVDIKPIAKLSNLKTLELQNNSIEDITCLSQNTNLTSLNLKQNAGIEADRAKYNASELEKIDKIGEILDRNGTINLDVDKLKLFNNYTSLDLSNQNLQNLSCLKGITELTNLNIGNNKELKIDDEESKEILQNMKNLKTVVLSNSSSITDISAFNSMASISSLELRGTNADLKYIEDIVSNITIAVSEQTLKTILNCDTNKITALNLSAAPTYTFESLPDLKDFTSLTTLSLPNVRTADYSMISGLTNLQTLGLQNCNLHGKINQIDFSKLTNLVTLNLAKNYLSTEDLARLTGLSGNLNMTIDLSNNSIINASSLLVLDPSTKIILKNNVNLTQESKDALKARFGSNVSY